MGPTWVLSAPAGPHVGPMNLVIREGTGVNQDMMMHHDMNESTIGKQNCGSYDFIYSHCKISQRQEQMKNYGYYNFIYTHKISQIQVKWVNSGYYNFNYAHCKISQKNKIAILLLVWYQMIYYSANYIDACIDLIILIFLLDNRQLR